MGDEVYGPSSAKDRLRSDWNSRSAPGCPKRGGRRSRRTRTRSPMWPLWVTSRPRMR